MLMAYREMPGNLMASVAGGGMVATSRCLRAVVTCLAAAGSVEAAMAILGAAWHVRPR